MSTDRTRPSISRVMVELGAISDGDEVIETACSLAAAIEAEIYGLFVEEESLMDLCALPFAHALLPGQAKARSLSPETLQQAYQRQATACRRTLSARARSAQLAWKFDTARGHSAAEIRAKVSGTDLVVFQQQQLGQSTHELVGMARSAAATASGVVVIGRRAHRAAGPIAVIDDGDDPGIETVALAARLAARLEAPVELFVIGADEAAMDRTEARDRSLLAGIRIAATHRFASPTDGLEDALTTAAPRFVVADLEGEPFCDNARAVRLIRSVRAPVVLIRPHPSD